ncbi:MAG: helix-turn-helix transcriptional regulator [Gammaproteobacteria bacterium]|jgi:XRE family aerobic/anaerobic benzoate catabolism transcriptional regulator|nr:transcriptional regulator [Chromatiales bacterium]MCP4925257.1 helix-turn-helix transcriptional regulator [Gammaproteobacteria bacterium]MDP7153498.1 helix-turn-helix transcriptional regulator [Gammaproteobacteria bacterium]MDP7296795.1 helix-turn-helix transcriptional regulator [Gammaproteobacteria bacterium]
MRVSLATQPDTKPAEINGLLPLVGKKVRNLRALRGMTRKMLAQRSDVSERYLAQLEQGCGNISIALLDRVAAALNIDVAELLRIYDHQTAEQVLVSELLGELTPDDQKIALQMFYERFSLSANSQRRVAVIGLRGAGKSTIGAMLAEQLGLPFIGLVSVIEALAGMNVSEVFALSGQAGYRRLEEQSLAETLKRHDRCVIEAGGSIVTEPRLLNILLTTCFVIWLQARPEKHMERVVEQGDLRPMLDHDDAMADLRSILTEREPFYAKAHLTIDTSDLSIEESLAAALRAVPGDIRQGG